MDPQELRSKLGGVIAFPITPFKADDLSLDIDGYRTNVAEMLEYDLCALVAAGGTGEMYSLTPDELIAVVKATVEESKGRMPVIAGVGFGGGLSVELAKEAEKAGADGLLMFPALLPQRGLRGPAALLPQHRPRDQSRLVHLFARLGQAKPGTGGPARRRGAQPRRTQGRPGRHSHLPAHHGAAGGPSALDWRHRRRHGAGLLFDRDSDLHILHRHHRAAPIVAATRARFDGRQRQPAQADDQLRSAALRIAGAAQGVRGHHDERGDEHPGQGRRSGAPAAPARSGKGRGTRSRSCSKPTSPSCR